MSKGQGRIGKNNPLAADGTPMTEEQTAQFRSDQSQAEWAGMNQTDRYNKLLSAKGTLMDRLAAVAGTYGPEAADALWAEAGQTYNQRDSLHANGPQKNVSQLFANSLPAPRKQGNIFQETIRDIKRGVKNLGEGFSGGWQGMKGSFTENWDDAKFRNGLMAIATVATWGVSGGLNALNASIGAGSTGIAGSSAAGLGTTSGGTGAAGTTAASTTAASTTAASTTAAGTTAAGTTAAGTTAAGTTAGTTATEVAVGTGKALTVGEKLDVAVKVVSGVTAVASVVTSSRDAKKEREQAKLFNEQATAQLKDFQSKIRAFRENLPAEKQAALTSVFDGYAKILQMRALAASQKDTRRVELFDDQMDQLDEIAKKQFGMNEAFITKSREVMEGVFAEMKDNLGGQIEYNRALQKEFGADMDEAISAERLNLGTAKDRLVALTEGRLPEGAAARISALKDKFSDISASVREEQAATGRRGRDLSTQIESARAQGELSANLQRDAESEARDQVSRSSANLSNISATRLQGMTREDAAYMNDLLAREAEGKLSLEEQDYMERVRIVADKAQGKQFLSRELAGGRMNDEEADALSRMADVLNQMDSNMGVEKEFRDLDFRALAAEGGVSTNLANNAIANSSAAASRATAAENRVGQSIKSFTDILSNYSKLRTDPKASAPTSTGAGPTTTTRPSFRPSMSAFNPGGADLNMNKTEIPEPVATRNYRDFNLSNNNSRLSLYNQRRR